jgi:hypothetical protein
VRERACVTVYFMDIRSVQFSYNYFTKYVYAGMQKQKSNGSEWENTEKSEQANYN